MSKLMSEERLAELEWLANNVPAGERHQQAVLELATEVRKLQAQIDKALNARTDRGYPLVIGRVEHILRGESE